MHSRLYDNPYQYDIPNIGLATISCSIYRILSSYSYDKEKFKFEERDISIIFKFEDFLNEARKWPKVMRSSISDFSAETLNSMIACKTLLLTPEKINKGNPDEIDNLINDLSNLLKSVKNQEVKNYDKLKYYSDWFYTFSNVVKKNPYPDCHGFCTCERGCDE